MYTTHIYTDLSRNKLLAVLSVPLPRPVAVPEPEAAVGWVVVSLLAGPRPRPCPRGHPVVPDGGAQPVILEHHEQEQAAEDDRQADQHNLGGVGGALLGGVWRWSGSRSDVTIL